MNERLPWYKHLYCDCGGVIRIKNYYTSICDRCGKESDLKSLNFTYVLANDKTGLSYPVVDRKD